MIKLYWNRFNKVLQNSGANENELGTSFIHLCVVSVLLTRTSPRLCTLLRRCFIFWSQLFHINKYICGNNPVCRKTCQKLNKSDRKETSPPAALPSVRDILSSVRFQLLISVPTPPGTQHVSGNIPTLTESFQPESVTEKQNALIKGLSILWPLCETWLLLSALGQHGNTLITAAEQNAVCCTPADSHGPLPPFCICAAGFSIKRVFWLQKQCSSDQHLCCVVCVCVWMWCLCRSRWNTAALSGIRSPLSPMFKLIYWKWECEEGYNHIFWWPSEHRGLLSPTLYRPIGCRQPADWIPIGQLRRYRGADQRCLPQGSAQECNRRDPTVQRWEWESSIISGL